MSLTNPLARVVLQQCIAARLKVTNSLAEEVEQDYVSTFIR